jgi:hypothetical protein
MVNLYRILRGNQRADSRGPEELRLIAAAYEAALAELKITPEDTATRELVASCVVEAAFRGERDAIRLRAHALAFRERMQGDSVLC